MRPALATKTYFVYIMASRRNGTLYIGVTYNVLRRAWEHKRGDVAGFTRRHGIKMLVYFEAFDDIDAAIVREKQMKKWNRGWKLRLIEEKNPDWRDLYHELVALETAVDIAVPTVAWPHC